MRLKLLLVDMKTRKFSPQNSGSKVICSGHTHGIAAMYHNIVQVMPFANWIDRESMNREKLASPRFGKVSIS